MKARLFKLAVVALILICTKLWVGVYEHDEFGTNHVFIKHRPIWKTHFYSPIGMSEMILINLPSEKQIEQLLFEEFVSSKGRLK